MWGICTSTFTFTFKLAMLLCILILPPAAPNIHGGGGGGNPANELVELMNANRTASKLPPLASSKGLGCMALQCISGCIAGGSGCGGSGDTVACDPQETDITEVYAPNCGVELPTVDVISGRLIGCSSSSSDSGGEWPAAAALAHKTVRGREHTQVGAGVDRHGPFFFWCVLFSSGSPNSTFLLDAAGEGIATQKHAHGCFSSPDNLSCSSAVSVPRKPTWLAGAGAGAAAAVAVPVLMFLVS